MQQANFYCEVPMVVKSPMTTSLGVSGVIERVDLNLGWAEAEVGRPGALVQVGDHFLPLRIDVHFPSVDGEPALDAVLEVVGGVPQCREIRVSSVAGGRGIGSRDSKRLRVPEWTEEIFAMFAWEADEYDKAGKPTRLVRHRGPDVQRTAVADVQRARARRAPDLDLVTTIYKANPSAPTRAVQEELGVSHRTASNYVKQAEKAGLLPKASPGKKRG